MLRRYFEEFTSFFFQIKSFKLVFHIPEDKRCLRMDEAYLSFNVDIPNCYLPGETVPSGIY